MESCADSLYDTAPTPSPSSSPRKRIREDTQGLQNSHEDFDRQTLGDFVSYVENSQRKTKASIVIQCLLMMY